MLTGKVPAGGGWAEADGIVEGIESIEAASVSLAFWTEIIVDNKRHYSLDKKYKFKLVNKGKYHPKRVEDKRYDAVRSLDIKASLPIAGSLFAYLTAICLLMVPIAKSFTLIGKTLKVIFE